MLLIWVQERGFLRPGSQNSLLGIYTISYLEVEKISFKAKRGGDQGLANSLTRKREGDFRSQLANQERSMSQSSFCFDGNQIPTKPVDRVSHLQYN